MDALGTPVRNEVPTQAVRQCSRGTDLGEALPNEGLDQILDLTTSRRLACFFSSAGSRPSKRAAKILCAWARAIGKVRRP